MMDRKKRVAPKRAANGKPATPSKKRTKNGSEDAVTGHLDDDVTVALPHEDGAPQYQLEKEDVKITKPTIPKLTDRQIMDALLLPPANIPPSKPRSSSSDLPQPDGDLPAKYAKLEQFFNALLNVYLYLQSRKQSCTWSLMKAPIESMCNDAMHLSYISQMQTVIPNAIKLSVWIHTTTNKLGKELALEIVSPSTSQPLNHSISTQLRQTFHESLIQLVKQHHTAFLGKRKPPKPPALWHPQFNLESVPDIPLTPLPSSLTEIPQPENPKETEKLDLPTVEKYIDSKPIPDELTGISPATIAAAREAEEGIMSESEDKKLVRILPGVVRTIHGLCVGEKKRAFPRVQLVAQMVSCSAVALGEEEAVQAMEKLAEIVPQWISMYRAEGETEWVRVNRDVKIADCLAAIQKESKK